MSKWYDFRDVNEALPHLARVVMRDGDEVGSRNGERVKELLHPHIVLNNPLHRELVNPLRKASLPAQIAETMWVLAGRDDIGWLSHYLPRAVEFSDNGTTWRGAYGPRLRAWERRDQGDVIDQLAKTIDLMRTDRATRRAVMSIFDPDIDSAAGKDIPCNDMLHFTSRLGRLDLHVFTRSNDLIWGWSGINAFEWSTLLEIVAGMLGVEAGAIHFSISSLHIYDRHWKRASELANHGDYGFYHNMKPSPRFDATHVKDIDQLDKLLRWWFETEEHIRDETVSNADLARLIDSFPEPMFRSWLAVLASWWRDEDTFLEPYKNTPLAFAKKMSPAPSQVIYPVAAHVPAGDDPFVEYVADLHAEKHAVYGPDSWKRRGESISILANIARKVDRLGVGGAGDTAADTVIDLLVYLLKYRLWLTDQGGPRPELLDGWINLTGKPFSDLEEPVRYMLHRLTKREAEMHEVPSLVSYLQYAFDDLEQAVEQRDSVEVRTQAVDDMIPSAAMAARALWNDEQAHEELVQGFSLWKGKA